MRIGKAAWPAKIIFTAIMLGALLFGCGVHEIQNGPTLAIGYNRWVILPFLNYSDTPQAGERAESITGNLLRVRGINDLKLYALPEKAGQIPYLDPRKRFDEALKWAQENAFAYGITGTIEEWRYKSGLAGEPAVGLGIQVIDLVTGRKLWSASGARSGWGRDTLSGTAHKLLKTLLDGLDLQ